MNCALCGADNIQTLPTRILGQELHCPVCGRYTITMQALSSGLIEPSMKHLLSAVTRRASDAGKPITLTTENISSLLESVPNLVTPLENLNRTLLLISKRQERANEFVQLEFDTDYPLVFAHDGNEFRYYALTLVEQDLVEARKVSEFASVMNGVRLTPAGWQRVLELQKTQRDSDQAFVAMWFDKQLDDVWEKGFKPALKSTGFHPYRVDRDEHNDKIDDRIVAEIRRSGLLVADFTGHRGGVYFEAGFAMGLGIPVIWTCRKSDIEAAHFDTRQYNHIVWSDLEDLKSKLALRISASIPGRRMPSEKLG